jgi:hypothetical protein
MGEPKIQEVPTYNISGVEVFSAGEWNKDKYSVNDLHDMVSAFNNLKVGFRPYLKLGHDNSQKLAKSSGLPSVGWVENLYVKGQKLFADFNHIPEKVFKLIKSKAYRKVSCEIYWNLDVDGNSYPRVVGAVALLGAENPGVMNLDDILGQYSLNQNNAVGVFKAFESQDTFMSYTTNFDAKEEKTMSQEEVETIKVELEAQKKSYAQAQADIDAKAKELEQAQAEIKQYRLDAEKAQAEAKASKIAQFVSELEGKKLVTPAMKDLVTELLSDKKEYTVKEKTMSKEEVLNEILTLSQEAAKVNFDESSRADFGKKEDKMKDLEDKIEKYSQDNKVSYAQAYKAVMKENKPEMSEE